MQPDVDQSDGHRDDLGHRNRTHMDSKTFQVLLDERLFDLGVDVCGFCAGQHAILLSLSYGLLQPFLSGFSFEVKPQGLGKDVVQGPQEESSIREETVYFCREERERHMRKKSQSVLGQPLRPPFIHTPCPVPADESFSDPGFDCAAEVGKAGQHSAVMLSEVLSPAQLPEEIPQEGKKSQEIKPDSQEFALRQFFRCVLVNDVADLPALNAALQDG